MAPPGGGEPLGIDAVAAAVLAGTVPGDGEVAGGVHGHGWGELGAGGVAVDHGLAALGGAAAVEPLGVDAVVAAVLAVAFPGDHEVAPWRPWRCSDRSGRRRCEC